MADREERYTRINETVITPDPNDPAAIRAEIRETRERMSHTVGDISERLNPDRLKEQVRHNIREATIGRAEHMARNAVDRVTETRHSIMDTIRDNPVPSAMVGIGLGWLFWNGRQHDTYSTRRTGYYQPMGDTGYRPQTTLGEQRYYAGGYDQPGTLDRTTDWASEQGENVRSRAEEMTNRTQETMGDMADRARESASEVANRARNMASDLAQETRHRADRMEDRFQGALQENPLAVGIAAVALGMAAGLSAPTTRREAEWMGGMRDQVMDRARDMAEEVTGRAQNVAGRVVEEAQSTAREAMQEQGTTSTGGGSSSMPGGSTTMAGSSASTGASSTTSTSTAPGAGNRDRMG